MIRQEHATMKVSTDSILLGAIANVEKAGRILDVGTGTGVIALMLAQRSSAKIDAVEILKDAFVDAKLNADASPWKSRISIYHISFQDYFRNFLSENEKYDLLISNPPYFSNSILPEKANKAIARHNQTLSDMDLLAGTDKVLKPDGSLWLIKPLSERNRFVDLAIINHFYVNSELKIRYKPGKKNTRVILQLSYKETELKTTEMTIENEDGGYSQEFIELTKEFYL